MSFLRRVLFSRWSVVLFATLVCIAAALAARRHASPPFAGFFGCFAVLCMVYAACAKNAVGRYVFIGLFSLFLALAGMEVYLRWKYPRALPHVVEITENGAPATWSVDDPVTGYKPRPGAAVRSVRKGRADGVVQYDVRYTVDEHSRRKVAQHPEARKAVLFFGCSFTFGEGLTDEDTLPYRVNEKIGGEFQAFNFGYSGYGPHQFLALLESSRLDDIWSKYEVAEVFFLSFPSHELRSGGFSSWDRNGPRYVLRDGRAVRQGVFSQASEWQGKLNWFFAKSSAYLMLFQSGRKSSQGLYDLQQAILLSAGDLLRQKNPNVRFTVLNWPENERAEKGFREAGLTVMPLEPLLPGYAENKDTYLIKNDGHPNARATSLIAEKVAAYILERK